MKRILLSSLFLMVFSGGDLLAQEKETKDEDTLLPSDLPKPTPAQLNWQSMEQTMFLCLDPCTWEGVEQGNHTYPIKNINPEKLDPDQWIDAAEAFGAKMIMFVAKHSSGFCWWQTETSEYSIKNTAYKDGKGDVLKELADACKKRGMKLGIYVYPGDLNYGAYLGGAGRTKDPGKQEEYNKIYRKQWEEVLSRYGEVTEIWFDGNCIIPIDDIKNKYAPNAIVFGSSMANIRWVGNERGIAPYPAWNSVKSEDAAFGMATAAHGDPNGDVWMPLEVNTTLKDHYWFWSPENEGKLKTMDNLLECYYKSVGRGGVFLLNAAPDTTGLIPEADMKLYKELGDEIRRRFGNSISEISGEGKIVEMKLNGVIEIDHVIIQEDIKFGERIRSYVLQGTKDGQEWFDLANGVSVGYKRINRFDPVKVRKIRLKSTKSVGTPIIKKLAVYYVGDPKVYDEFISNKDDYGQSYSLGESKQYEDLQRLGVVSQYEIEHSDQQEFFIDLSKFIDRPGQYELFISEDVYKKPINPKEIRLILQGVETPGFSKINSLMSRMELNITAHPTMDPETVMVRFTLKDSVSSESVYLRKVVFK